MEDDAEAPMAHVARGGEGRTIKSASFIMFNIVAGFIILVAALWFDAGNIHAAAVGFACLLIAAYFYFYDRDYLDKRLFRILILEALIVGLVVKYAPYLEVKGRGDGMIYAAIVWAIIYGFVKLDKKFSSDF